MNTADLALSVEDPTGTGTWLRWPSAQLPLARLSEIRHRPISEVAVQVIEVCLARHGGPDLLTSSSSHFDPLQTFSLLQSKFLLR